MDKRVRETPATGHPHHSGNAWKIVAVGLLTALLVTVPLAGPLLVVRDPLRAAGAIVVIGGDYKPERVQRAVELYRQGQAPLVIISAGTPVLEGGAWLPEAEVMGRQAIALGLPERAIVMEADSRSTRENAERSYRICRERGIGSILLVTSAYHSRRARRIFRDVYGAEIAVSAQPAPESAGVFWWLDGDAARVVGYEYWNWLGYWWARRITQG